MNETPVGTKHTTVTGAWVTVERSVETRGDEIIVVVTMTAAAPAPVGVHVVEELPESWPVKTIGVHPDYEPREFEADPARIAFDAVVDSGARTEVVYGIKLATLKAVEPLGPLVIEEEQLLEADVGPATTPNLAGDGGVGPLERAAGADAWPTDGVWESTDPPAEPMWPDAGSTHSHDDIDNDDGDGPPVEPEGGPDGEVAGRSGSMPEAAFDGRAIDRFTDLPGVGPDIAGELHAAGFETVTDLRQASEADLSAVNGVGPTLAAAITAVLRESSADTTDPGAVEHRVETDPETAGPSAPHWGDAGDPGPAQPAEVGSADGPETLGDAHSLLVLADHDHTDVACVHLFERQRDPAGGMYLISFVDSADHRLEAVSQLSGGERDIDVFCMGEHLRSSAAETSIVPTPFGEATVTAIADPGDLFRLGVHVSRALEEAEGRPELCLHSLSALIALVDLQRVFRFIHLLSGRVNAAGGRAHYHLDPNAVDDRAFAALRPLFDGVVRYEDGQFTIE